MTEPFQSGQHLSPDQLSAFAENALPEHERLVVLTHLSACAECRQVVFLAQQADPAPVVAPASETPRRSWFTLPQIFAASTAALACSLILALIIHLHPGQNQAAQPTATAQLQTPQPIAPPQPAPAQEPAPQTPTVNTNAPAAVAPPKPVQVQMAPAPQQVGAMDSGRAIGEEFKAKVAEPQMKDKIQTANSNANASTFAVLAPQKSPAVVGGMMAMSAPPPAAPAQMEARARQSYSGAAAAPAPTSSVDVNAMADTIDAASIENLPLNGRANEALAMRKAAIPAIKLPSKKSVASVINAPGGRTLALDTDGVLFVSNDSGKHWTAVAPQWPGKAVQLSFAPTPARLYLAQPAQNQAQSQLSNSNSGATVAAGVPQQQAPIPTAGFQLTTATGAVWVSTDGLAWHPR